MKLRTMIAMPLALVAAMTLTACPAGEGTQAPAADGYSFGEPDMYRFNQPITVVVYENVTQLRRAARGRGVRLDRGNELMAFGEINPDVEKGCIIHVVDPQKDYQPEWIGHELAHCVWGRWHS